MIRKYNLLILAILLMVSLSFPSSLAAKSGTDDENVMQILDRLSQEVVIHTEKGQLDQAKGKLEQLADIFPNIGTEKKISIEALELASNTIVQGKRALSDITPDKKEILWHATQIRILVDALTHPNQPIWKGYYMTYLEQVSKMLHQAQRSQQEDLNKALQQNYKLYTIIKPALAVNYSSSTIQELDSLYNFLVQQLHEKQVPWDAIQQSLEHLRELTGNIFLGEERNTFSWYISNNSPVAMISMISFILVTVLSYAAWRMYRGERFQI